VTDEEKAANTAARAKFAEETGRTVEEWLELVRTGAIDKDAHAERYQVAVALEAQGWTK
jgi:hypothetical protein